LDMCVNAQAHILIQKTRTLQFFAFRTEEYRRAA
jgi:hypothetical protein